VDCVRRFGFVVALLAAELGAVVAMHRLGRVEGFALPRRAVGHWLLHAPTDDLVAVSARLVGIALAWWLLVATVLSVARRVVPGWRTVRALDALAPAALRRLVDRAVVLGLGASIGLSGMGLSGARAATAAGEPSRARADTPVVRSPNPPAAPVAPTTPRAAPSVATPASAVVVVRAGDNLWVIAHAALAQGDRLVEPAAVSPYWRRVIEANTTRLRSHDPNLIFPGERVVLPPVPGEERRAG